MKFTLSWLKTHLDTDADLQAVLDTLNSTGLEVEDVVDRATELAEFRVCYVISAEQHPDADRLRVCQVDTGTETVQVVCGAPNARTGMKGVFAASGMTVPGTGLLLKPSKIRGVESNGMLVSEREMGLSDEHDGIIEMPEDSPVGEPFAPLMGLDDPMIEVAITPNRQDCLGVYGIARDLAAAGLGTLKQPNLDEIAGSYESPVKVHLKFDDDHAHACPVFAGRYVRGVKNGPSPKWLQDRLLSIGLRPISILVDITNFVTMDLGRPLHVFDADKLTGDIQVRMGCEGEKFTALDGEEYEVDTDACVVADDSGAHSFGGIMGGESTGCSDETVNVFIESAWFDPILTATTGRRMGIESDARYRFERGVDPESVTWGIQVATRLVQELCGGNASEMWLAGEVPDTSRTVSLRASRVKSLGGIDVPEADIKRILTALGFGVSGEGEAISATVPSWRKDVDGEADLVEDIIRIYGLDKVESVQLPRVGDVAHPSLNLDQRRRRLAKRILAGRSMNEALTWSFLHRDHAALFGGGQPELTLDNPISTDLDTMRPSMLPNLIAATGRNAARGMHDVALFEVGPQYAGDQPGDQAIVAAGIRKGRTGERHWLGEGRAIDAYDAKADVEALLNSLGIAAENAQVVAQASDYFHPGRSGRLQLGPKMVLAQFGELHPAVLDKMDVEGPIVGFEIYLDNLPKPRAGKKTTRAALNASDYQAVQRDFAFVVDENIEAAKLIRAARGADRNLITRVNVFDVYQGEHLEPGKKSIAISVRMEPDNRTMTDDEIDAMAQKIVQQVQKATKATLRG